MKINAKNSAVRGSRAFTLIEALVVGGLLLTLIASTMSTILGMQISAYRVSQYTATMAIAQAKLEDIRAVYYNPPNYPFTTNTLYLTNQDLIALDQAGATFLVPGSVVSKIEYQGAIGHLVTVTVSFTTTHVPMTITMQSMVNKFSGGLR